MLLNKLRVNDLVMREADGGIFRVTRVETMSVQRIGWEANGEWVNSSAPADVSLIFTLEPIGGGERLPLQFGDPGDPLWEGFSFLDVHDPR